MISPILCPNFLHSFFSCGLILEMMLSLTLHCENKFIEKRETISFRALHLRDTKATSLPIWTHIVFLPSGSNGVKLSPFIIKKMLDIYSTIKLRKLIFLSYEIFLSMLLIKMETIFSFPFFCLFLSNKSLV